MLEISSITGPQHSQGGVQDSPLQVMPLKIQGNKIPKWL